MQITFVHVLLYFYHMKIAVYFLLCLFKLSLSFILQWMEINAIKKLFHADQDKLSQISELTKFQNSQKVFVIAYEESYINICM